MGHGPQVAVTAPLVARQTGIKTIAAVHSQCRSWVIRCGAIQPPSRPLSVVSPTATLVLQCNECPLCATCVFRCDEKKQRDFSPSPTNRPKCLARASDLSRRATNDLVFNLQLESTSLIISLRDKQ